MEPPQKTAFRAGRCSPQSARNFRAVARPPMKAKIVITPKKAVLDPQGKIVQNALEHMGYQGVAGVHVGTDAAAARKALDEACHRFLSNPVIEDYRLEIAE